MGAAESTVLVKMGFDDVIFDELKVLRHDNGAIVPYIVLCSEDAKLLHFNGAVKPWLLNSYNPSVRLPLCAAPRTVPSGPYPWLSPRSIVLSGPEQGTKMTFISCNEIWDIFSSHEPLKSKSTDATDEKILSNEMQTMNPCLDQNAEKVAEPKKEREKKVEVDVDWVPGGFKKFQEVKAAANIMVRGKIIVQQGTKGIIQGPSIRHPKERINVLFAQRKDGKTRTVNVMPAEIQASGGE
eukprot:UN0058